MHSTDPNTHRRKVPDRNNNNNNDQGTEQEFGIPVRVDNIQHHCERRESTIHHRHHGKGRYIFSSENCIPSYGDVAQLALFMSFIDASRHTHDDHVGRAASNHSKSEVFPTLPISQQITGLLLDALQRRAHRQMFDVRVVEEDEMLTLCRDGESNQSSDIMEDNGDYDNSRLIIQQDDADKSPITASFIVRVVATEAVLPVSALSPARGRCLCTTLTVGGGGMLGGACATTVGGFNGECMYDPIGLRGLKLKMEVVEQNVYNDIIKRNNWLKNGEIDVMDCSCTGSLNVDSLCRSIPSSRVICGNGVDVYSMYDTESEVSDEGERGRNGCHFNNGQDSRPITIYRLCYPRGKFSVSGVQDDQGKYFPVVREDRHSVSSVGVNLSMAASRICRNKTIMYSPTVHPSSLVSSVGNTRLLRLIYVNDRILGCVVSSISHIAIHTFFSRPSDVQLRHKQGNGELATFPDLIKETNTGMLHFTPLAICIRKYTPTPHGSSNFIPPSVSYNTCIPILFPTSTYSDESFVPYLPISSSSIPPNSPPFLLHTAFKTINRLGLLNLARLLCGGYSISDSYNNDCCTSFERSDEHRKDEKRLKADDNYNTIKDFEHQQQHSIIRALFSVYLLRHHNHNSTFVGDRSTNPNLNGKEAYGVRALWSNRDSCSVYGNCHNYRPSMISLWHSPSNDPNQYQDTTTSHCSTIGGKRPSECPSISAIGWSGGMSLTYVWAHAILLQRSYLHQYPRPYIITHVTIAYTNCDPFMLHALGTAAPSLLSLTLEFVGTGIRADHLYDFFQNRKRNFQSVKCHSSGTTIVDRFESLRLRHMKHLFDECRSIDRGDTPCSVGDTLGRGVYDFLESEVEEVKTAYSLSCYKCCNNNNYFVSPHRQAFELEIAECGLTDVAAVALFKALRRKVRISSDKESAVRPVYISLPNNKLTERFLRSTFVDNSYGGNDNGNKLSKSGTVEDGSPTVDDMMTNLQHVIGLNITNNNMKHLKGSELYCVLYGLTPYRRCYRRVIDIDRNITVVKEGTLASHHHGEGMMGGTNEDMSSRDNDVYRYSTRYCNLNVGVYTDTVVHQQHVMSNVPRLLLMQGTCVPLEEWVNFMRLVRRLRENKETFNKNQDEKGGWSMCTLMFPSFTLSFSQGYVNTLHLSPPSSTNVSDTNGVPFTFYQTINKLLGDSCGLLPRFLGCAPIDLEDGNPNSRMGMTTLPTASCTLQSPKACFEPKSSIHIQKSISSGNARKRLEKKRLLIKKEKNCGMRKAVQGAAHEIREMSKKTNNTKKKENGEIRTNEMSHTGTDAEDLEACAFWESLGKDAPSEYQQQQNMFKCEDNEKASSTVSGKPDIYGDILKEDEIWDKLPDETDNQNGNSESLLPLHQIESKVSEVSSVTKQVNSLPPYIARFSQMLAPYLACLSLAGCDLREGRCTSTGTTASSKKLNKYSTKDTTSLYFPSNHVFFNSVLVSLLPLLRSLDLSYCFLGNEGVARLGAALEKSALLLQQIHSSPTIGESHYNNTTMMCVVEIGLPLTHLKLDHNNITGVDVTDNFPRDSTGTYTRKNQSKAPKCLVNESSTLSIRYFLKGLRGCICPALESLSLKYNIISMDDDFDDDDEWNSDDNDGQHTSSYHGSSHDKTKCGTDNLYDNDVSTHFPYHYHHPLFKSLFIFASQVNKAHFRELDLSGNKGLFRYIRPIQRHKPISSTDIRSISALSYLVDSFKSSTAPTDGIHVTSVCHSVNVISNPQTVVIHLKDIDKFLERQWNVYRSKTRESFCGEVCKAVECSFI